MKYCFPIAKAKGLESRVYPHFGSAPWYLIVQSDDSTFTLVPGPTDQPHGTCRPVDHLLVQDFDAMVVGGIGAGAVARFKAVGKKVFLSGAPTVQKNLEILSRGELPEVDPMGYCVSGGGHGHGMGHGGRCGGGHHGMGRGGVHGMGHGALRNRRMD